MIHNRLAIVSVASVLFAAASAAAAAVAPAPVSSEFSGLGQKVDAISAAMGNQDMSKAAEGLNGLFTGSGSKKDSSGSAPVVAGDWKVSPRLELAMSRPQAPRRQAVPAGLLTLRGDAQTQEAKFVTVGLREDAIIAAAQAAAAAAAAAAEKAAEEYVNRDRTEESKEKYGGCRMKGTCEK